MHNATQCNLKLLEYACIDRIFGELHFLFDVTLSLKRNKIAHTHTHTRNDKPNENKHHKHFYYFKILLFVSSISLFWFGAVFSEHANSWVVGLLAVVCISITILACTCCHRNKSGFEVSTKIVMLFHHI